MGYTVTQPKPRIPAAYIFVIGDEHQKHRRSASDSIDTHCRFHSLWHKVVQRDDAMWAAQVLSATPFYHVITVLGVVDGNELRDFWTALEEEDVVHLLVLDNTVPLGDTFGSQVEVWRPSPHSGVPYSHIVKSIARKLRK